MSAVMVQRIQPLAVGLTIVLLLQLAWGVFRWFTLSPPEPIEPAASSLSVSGVDRGALEQQMNAGESLVSKPLFWAGRQPYIPPEGTEEVEITSVAASGPTSIDKTRLLGAYASGSSHGVILLHQGKQLRVNIGESVDGWTLSMMAPDGAIFESGEESRTLSLEHFDANAASKKPRATARKRAGARKSSEPITN